METGPIRVAGAGLRRPAHRDADPRCRPPMAAPTRARPRAGRRARRALRRRRAAGRRRGGDERPRPLARERSSLARRPGLPGALGARARQPARPRTRPPGSRRRCPGPSCAGSTDDRRLRGRGQRGARRGRGRDVPPVLPRRRRARPRRGPRPRRGGVPVERRRSSGRSSSTTTSPRCCSRSGWPSTTSASRTPASSPGELDQEQHDAVRDVFYVSRAAMLVRADLFPELGGFDPDDVPRLGGPRPLLARPARRRARARRARRHGSGTGSRRCRTIGRRDATTTATCGRSPRAASVSSQGLLRLALFWVLPTAFVLNVAEAVGLVFTRRPGRARALLAGWFAAFAAGRRAPQGTRGDTAHAPRRRRRRARPDGAGERAHSHVLHAPSARG